MVFAPNCGQRSCTVPSKRQMLEMLIPFAAMGLAIWLGMITADKFAAMTQRRWRYSLRTLLIAMAMMSVILTVVVSIARK